MTYLSGIANKRKVYYYYFFLKLTCNFRFITRNYSISINKNIAHKFERRISFLNTNNTSSCGAEQKTIIRFAAVFACGILSN